MMSKEDFLMKISLPAKKKNLEEVLKRIDSIWDKYLIYSRVKGYNLEEFIKQSIKDYFRDKCNSKESFAISPKQACLFYFKHGKELGLEINSHVLSGLKEISLGTLKEKLGWKDELIELTKYSEEDQVHLINKIYGELIDNL